MRDLPARVNRLALGAALKLLHGNRANVLQVVGTRVGDDGVPDDSLVGGIAGAWPLGSDVDEELLSVPCEEGREVGFEGELDDGVLLLLGAVVVRTTLDTVTR